jgi:hypothetical protein
MTTRTYKSVIGINKYKLKKMPIPFQKLFKEIFEIKKEYDDLKFKISKNINFGVIKKLKNQKEFLENLLNLKENQLFLIAVEKNKNSLQNYFTSEPDEKSQYGSKYYNKNLKLYYLNNNQILNLEFDKIRISNHKSGINFNNYERIYKTIDDIKIGLPERIVENQTAFSGKQKGWSLKYEPIGLDFVINNNNEHTILENIDKITAILTINLN